MNLRLRAESMVIKAIRNAMRIILIEICNCDVEKQFTVIYRVLYRFMMFGSQVEIVLSFNCSIRKQLMSIIKFTRRVDMFSLCFDKTQPFFLNRRTKFFFTKFFGFGKEFQLWQAPTM